MKTQRADSESLHRGTQSCLVCALDPECLLWQLASADARRVERIAHHPAPFPKGASLFKAGDGLHAIYAVRAGAFKRVLVDGVGREEVLGFSFPGELLGLDGLHAQRHEAAAVALEDSAVCVLPYLDLTDLMRDIDTLRQQVLRLASRDFDGGRRGTLTSEQRVARFLLDMVERRHSNGHRDGDMELVMSTEDMASYLRLAPEQVLEDLSGFTATGLISLERRRLRLLDSSRLGLVAQNGHSRP